MLQLDLAKEGIVAMGYIGEPYKISQQAITSFDLLFWMIYDINIARIANAVQVTV